MKDKFNKEPKEGHLRKLKKDQKIDHHHTDQEVDANQEVEIEIDDNESSPVKWLLPLLLVGVLCIGVYLMNKVTQGVERPAVGTEQKVK